MPDRSSKTNPLVIIPVYQLEDAIQEMVDESTKYIAKENLLFVDDGSKDNTSNKIEDLGINYLRHHTNRGKGMALRSAFAYFCQQDKFDSVITIDGDLQHPPNKIPEMIAMLDDGYDLVMGNRMTDLSDMPVQRRFSNTMSSWGISVTLRQKLPDTQCGFRAIKGWVIRRLQLKSVRYAIESEVALQAGFMGAKFGHLPIPTIYNENPSHMEPFMATFRITKLITGFFLKNRFGKLKIQNGDSNDDQ
ncbi:MAG: glycosyltransferase family 2 protein [Candidatus Zixiibacteriota bacterium]